MKKKNRLIYQTKVILPPGQALPVLDDDALVQVAQRIKDDMKVEFSASNVFTFIEVE